MNDLATYYQTITVKLDDPWGSTACISSSISCIYIYIYIYVDSYTKLPAATELLTTMSGLPHFQVTSMALGILSILVVSPKHPDKIIGTACKC